jgi:RNA polymerase sigma-70 factor (ECF subfamily)
MVNEDDNALVRQAVGGSREAFDELVRRFQGPIYNLALRITGDTDDAMDVTQATFLKAYDRLDSFDPSRRFFSWLYRIGVHEALNLRTQKARNPRVPIDFEIDSPADDPERELSRKEGDALVAAAMRRLRPTERALIALRHLQGLGYEEISEALELSTSQVKSRLFDARRRLRELWAALGGVR